MKRLEFYSKRGWIYCFLCHLPVGRDSHVKRYTGLWGSVINNRINVMVQWGKESRTRDWRLFIISFDNNSPFFDIAWKLIGYLKKHGQHL